MALPTDAALCALPCRRGIFAHPCRDPAPLADHLTRAEAVDATNRLAVGGGEIECQCIVEFFAVHSRPADDGDRQPLPQESTRIRA